MTCFEWMKSSKKNTVDMILFFAGAICGTDKVKTKPFRDNVLRILNLTPPGVDDPDFELVRYMEDIRRRHTSVPDDETIDDLPFLDDAGEE